MTRHNTAHTYSLYLFPTLKPQADEYLGEPNRAQRSARRATSRWRRRAVFGLMLALSAAAHGQQDLAQPDEQSAIVVSNYSHLRIDDGLCSDRVNVIFRDSEGLMWFGTDEGLNSYDGYVVRTFAPEARDTSAIVGKRVCDIQEFERNRLSLALADGGANVYDKAARAFRRSMFSQSTSPEFGSALGLCKQGDYVYGVFPSFVSKRSVGDEKEGSHFIDRLSPEALGPGGSGRTRICPMPGIGGQIAILLSQRTLGMLDTKYENIAEYTFADGRIYDICPFDAEHVLLATSDGIYSFDLHSKNFSPMGILRDQMVQCIRRSKENDFWVAYAGNKILKWNSAQGKSTAVVGVEEILNAQTHVNDIYEDENGLLWIATNNSGVLKIDTKKPKISTSFIANFMSDSYLTKDMSVADGKVLWCACGEDGLVRVDLSDRLSTDIPLPVAIDATCVLTRQNGIVLVGSSDGVWRYDQVSGDFARLPLYEADSSAVYVNELNGDCLGNAWVSTQSGLYRFNGATFEKMQTVDGGVYSFNAVTDDSDGRIWAGSSSGLFVRGVGEKVFKRIGRRWSGRPFDGVLCLAEYKEKMLVGTSEGVMVYDRRTLEPESNKVFAKFNNRSILSIACDRDGVIWVSTNAEVGCVDANYSNVYLFGHRDGLVNQGNECHKFDVYGDVLYFGHVTAVNTIDTKNVSFNASMPRTFVSEVIYGASGSEALMPMANDTTFSQLYVVSASTKIHLASTDYSDPTRSTFSYRINDGEWQDLNGTNEILASGLLPGTYRLMLRCANADYVWSSKTSTVYVRLESPLWLSKPAIIFYAIWLMAIVWLILNFRFRKINKRMRLAEAEAKSKSIVEDQRNRLVHAINEQHASFNYAKRIQDALMPKVDSVDRFFSKFFVFYKPKEIVSGDFYTFYHRDDKTFVVSADCTGHGVPGAFISILGIDHISNIIMRQKVDDAGEILTRLQEELRSAVTKIGSAEVNDGMDITVCVVYHDEKKINFAGAMNDLYLIRNNEVTVYHGDRMSIGVNVFGRAGESQPFNSITFDGQSGDMLYMFSDGYCDQFGGPEHKKFKARRFKNLLLNVHKLPANDQRQLLGLKLIEWMGNTEQTDDVSIVGFEPWA